MKSFYIITGLQDHTVPTLGCANVQPPFDLFDLTYFNLHMQIRDTSIWWRVFFLDSTPPPQMLFLCSLWLWPQRPQCRNESRLTADVEVRVGSSTIDSKCVERHRTLYADHMSIQPRWPQPIYQLDPFDRTDVSSSTRHTEGVHVLFAERHHWYGVQQHIIV